MAVITGKGGSVSIGTNVVEHIKKWSATTTIDLTAFASSSTNGWKQRTQGNRDITGSFEAMIHTTGFVGIQEGDEVTLNLIIDKDATNPSKLSGPATVKSVKIEEDIESSEPLGYTVEFEGNGTWTRTGGLLVD